MITEKFSKSYDAMLEQAYRFQTGFSGDKADFIAFATMFADPFAADLLTDIQAADALPIYEDDLSDLVVLTTAVDDTMELCRLHFQKLMFFVNLVYPGKEDIADSFGAGRYNDVRSSALKLINLMQRAYLKANSAPHKAALIAQGFLQADIDLLDSLADDLTDANNEQEDFKSIISLRAQTRIEAFNTVWDSMVKISEASKIIYKENPAKFDFYLLYPDTPNPNAPPAPVNLTWTLATNTFAWDVVGTATSYQLMYKMAAGEEWLEAYNGVNISTVFEPGAGEWDFRVRARNASGYGPYSDTLNILVPGGLAPPDNVAAVYLAAPDDYLSLTWDSVYGATGYKLYESVVNLGQPSGIYTSPTFPVSSPYVVNGPTTGKRYYYMVAATAPGQMSEPSGETYVDIS